MRIKTDKTFIDLSGAVAKATAPFLEMVKNACIPIKNQKWVKSIEKQMKRRMMIKIA